MKFDCKSFKQLFSKLFNNIKKNKKKQLVFFVSIILLFGLYGELQTLYIRRNGVYIVATVLSVRPAPRGYTINIAYSYMNKQYKELISSDISLANKGNIGKKFIFAILRDHPTTMTYIDYAPDCLGDNPPEGWSEIPKCE